MNIRKPVMILSLAILFSILFLSPYSFPNTISDNFCLPNLLPPSYWISIDLQKDLDSIFDKLAKILHDLESILGLDRGNQIKFVILTLLYLSLSFFLLFWFIELIFKIIKKIFSKEQKEFRVKKVARIAFKTTLVGNLLYLGLAIAGLFWQAVALSHFYKTYIKKPENLISLIQGDKVFLVILGLTILFYLFKRRFLK